MGWEVLVFVFGIGWCLGWDSGRKGFQKEVAKFAQGLMGKPKSK